MTNAVVGKLGRGHLEDLDIDGRIILNGSSYEGDEEVVALVPVAQGTEQWPAVGNFGLRKMRKNSRLAQVPELIRKDSAPLNQ
jgi:hypothetical protein